MKFVEEFRNGELAQGLCARIARLSKRPLSLMEVCGSHTVSIFRHGIRDLLPPTLRLLSGPGCPVCVTASSDVDKALLISRTPGVIFLTFGDMMRVPGVRGSLQEARAKGADVRIVYSPLDALHLAEERPDRKVVFFGVGFETTSPLIAATLKRAMALGLKNFYLLSVHKLIPPALRFLVSHREVKIDGFLLPGHVSAIIGSGPYQFLAKEFGVPAVISGFEPLDILQSICMLVEQAERGEAKIQIQYGRVVSPEGNQRAMRCLEEVFSPVEDEWRGLGWLSESGLKLREEWKDWDAESRFDLSPSSCPDPPSCQCGEVLRGVLLPAQCSLFGESCSPEHPVGPCMVSTEGTCSIHYRYGRVASHDKSR
ncbi:MAG: hydrogenase formation protein HypD [candidate division NC10 bacterium]|nr:hydrogenase formation protein HypD [candidate division NC10 bacterium]